MIRFINKILFGGTYKVVHIDRITGNRKIFWCNTWQDAIEWVACAVNDDRVVVTDTAGYIMAQRG
jgi:hypothetical protein